MNQDQRELLELAAYAFWPDRDEVSFWFDESEEAIVFIAGENQDHNGRDVELVWNPLANKADAFDLMVKLHFSIAVHPRTIGISQYGEGKYLVWEEIGLDEEAATMLAITRAAAAIGKQMKEQMK